MTKGEKKRMEELEKSVAALKEAVVLLASLTTQIIGTEATKEIILMVQPELVTLYMESDE